MQKDNAKKENLGRGLEALLGDDEPVDFLSNREDSAEEGLVKNISLTAIHRFEDQPRQNFDAEQMESLVESIKEKGVLQPVLVRKLEDSNNQYQLIAGERRWRAAQRAGLHDIPAIIKSVSDDEASEISLIENIQRENLSPVEEALAYKKLMEQSGYTQEDLAKKLSKSRSAIANAVRLLSLPEAVQKMLNEGKITAGHARNLVGREDALELAEKIIGQNLSVRDAENEIKASPIKNKIVKEEQKEPNIKDLEEKLETLLGLKARFKTNGEAGILSFHYQSAEQLESLLELVGLD